MKKNTLLICALLISNSNIFSSPTIYKKIQPHIMSTIEFEDEEWPNEPYAQYLARCFDYQTHLQEFKKTKITLQIFDALEQQRSPLQSALYDMITADDINLLRGQKKDDPSVATMIDRTQTHWGKLALRGIISNPTSDISLLEQRQEIIRFLLAHEDCYAKLRDAFDILAQTQNIVLSFWAQDGFLQTSNRSYFSLPYFTSTNEELNNSTIALQTRSLYQHYTRLASNVVNALATSILAVYAVALLTNKSLPGPLEALLPRMQGAAGDILATLMCSINNKYIASAGTILTSTYLGLSAKEMFEWTRDCFSLELYLQKKLIVVAQFFKALCDVREIFATHPEFLEKCPPAQALNDHLTHLENTSHIQQLLNLLKTKTFTGEASIFSYHGKVLAAYRLMHDLKKEFEPLLLTLGELDAYLSCATLYKEFQNQRVTFCFAHYCQTALPTLELFDFWNPLIDSSRVIANNLSMGGENHRNNVIITGPNAGGKSALIKGVVINLILTQSIGLAAATRATITPFYSIATYLNIADDIASGNSLFKAQVLRAQEMIILAETTPAGQFSFIALDEMFNGTSAKESKAAALSVIQHLGAIPNCMCIAATHFPLLTTLEATTKSFANYKVSVTVDPLQGIYYPFKLEQGSSQQHIALDILKQEGFDTAIINNAASMLTSMDN